MRQLYDWRRYWCPRDGRIGLSEHGFLEDPSGVYGRALNPALVILEGVEEIPCLVLLGEPGIGKTTTIVGEHARVRMAARNGGPHTHKIDLRAVGSGADLHRRLIGAVEVAAWLEDAESKLVLFLDGLDECRAHFPQIAAALAEELSYLPTSRLRLRLACRTADWQVFLEGKLRELYGGDSVAVLELAPLTRSDVAVAAQARGLDVHRFMSAILDRGVGPLAAKPLTLEFLLNSFERGGALPTTQAELYEHGLRRLCEELSESRRASGATGDSTAEVRFAVAARIAGVLVFSGRDAIWTGPDLGDVPATDVTVGELAGEPEMTPGEGSGISESIVREALSTGLFTARGPERLGFAHQSYAECLAALYLRQRKLKPSQVLGLLLHPDGGVIPQLRGVTAWAAVLDSAIFDVILENEPEVLLRADITETPPAQRERLTEELLLRHERGEVMRRFFFDFIPYHQLAHPELGKQLRPWIARERGNDETREIAIKIAGLCGVVELGGGLADVALDPAEPHDIRVAATLAVARLRDSTARERLRPLALADQPDDDRDSIKGLALQALWPDHLSIDEVLGTLKPPRLGSNYYGTYQAFLTQVLAEEIFPADLPVALRWAAEHVRMGEHPTLGDAADAILLRAWRHVDDANVLGELARTTMVRLEQQYAAIDRPLDGPNPLEDVEKRRAVLAAIMALLSGPDHDVILLAEGNQPLARTEDVPWIVGRMQGIRSEAERQAWAELLRAVFRHDAVQADAVLCGAEVIPELREAFGGLLGQTDLNSPLGRKLKADYLYRERRRHQMERRRQARVPVHTPTAPEVEELLTRAEADDENAFPNLVAILSRNPDGSPGDPQISRDLRSLPGWRAADPRTKERITEAAKRYIAQADPQTELWLDNYKAFWPAEAGHSAYLHLQHESQSYLHSLGDDVWRRWTPALIGIGILHLTGTAKENKLLMMRARDRAPAEFAQTFLRCVRLELGHHGVAYGAESYHELIDDAVAADLLKIARDPSLEGRSLESVLGASLRAGRPEAIHLTRSLVESQSSAGGTNRDRSIAAGRLLLAHRPEEGWPVVLAAIQADSNFGDELLTGAADSAKLAEELARLDSVLLADLFIWLQERLLSSGPLHASRPSDLEVLASRALEALVGQGTESSIQALNEIASRFPTERWLRDHVHAARANAREQSWKPPTPADVLALASMRGNHLVRNAEELQWVVLESLERIQGKLKGHLPHVRLLWDTRGAPRPKDEEDLSDFLAERIQDDLVSRGIIVNREVQIRRGSSGKRGERTDIHIDAVSYSELGPYDRITVVVEVKGCWHAEVTTAMETQLVGRYLADSQTTHGIYLVGWFLCDAWDSEDYRKGKTEKRTLDEAREHFTAQAADLSRAGIEVRTVVLDLRL